MNDPGSKLVHTFAAWSEIDQGQKYYDFMDFGAYRTEWPDLAVRPYFFTDALLSLRALKKPLKPLGEFVIFGDGSCRPSVPSPMPRIVIQDAAAFAVDIWISGDYGGVGEGPLNQVELIRQADTLIRATKPDLLRFRQSTYLICPLEIAERMEWRAYEYTPDKPGVSS